MNLPELPEARRARLKLEANAAVQVVVSKPTVKPLMRRKKKDVQAATAQVTHGCTLGGVIEVKGTTIYGPTIYTSDSWMHLFADQVESFISKSGFKERPVCVKYIANNVVCVYQDSITPENMKFMNL